jgi:phage FluMu gp28-like protein
MKSAAPPRGARRPQASPSPIIVPRITEPLRAVVPPAVLRQSKELNPEQRTALKTAIVSVLDDWLRPYQREWLADTSQHKVANWSRQIGKSEVISLEAILQGLEPPETMEKCEILVSASQSQANEIMMKAVRWSHIIDEIARKTLGVSIYMNGKGPQSAHPEQIWLYNSVRVITLPANPYSAAGYHGDVFWDEVAKTPHDDLMWDALHPMISGNNYRFRATSTPWGDQGKYYEIWHNLPDWSKHQVTIIDAVRQGVPRDLESMRRQYDAITWAQNYLCRFLSSLTSAYPRDLLKAAIELYSDLPDLPRAPAPGVWPDDVYVTLGIDIGRTNDRTALVWEYEYPQGCYRFERVRQLVKMPFAQQEQVIREILRGGEVHKCQIDSTGIGMQMAENLSNEFPEIVRPVTFTNQQKAQMVLAMRADFERGVLAMVPDNDLLSDFTSVRQEILESSRTVRFGSARTASGHADGHWAAGLAHDAQVNRAEWQVGDSDVDEPVIRRRQQGKGFSIETPLPVDPYYGGMGGMPKGSDITGGPSYEGDLDDLSMLDDETLEMKLLGLDPDDYDEDQEKRTAGRRAQLFKGVRKKS